MCIRDRLKTSSVRRAAAAAARTGDQLCEQATTLNEAPDPKPGRAEGHARRTSPKTSPKSAARRAASDERSRRRKSCSAAKLLQIACSNLR
eukprot:5703341-Alexandrium_andersonii.AAC.1